MRPGRTYLDYLRDILSASEVCLSFRQFIASVAVVSIVAFGCTTSAEPDHVEAEMHRLSELDRNLAAMEIAVRIAETSGRCPMKFVGRRQAISDECLEAIDEAWRFVNDRVMD